MRHAVRVLLVCSLASALWMVPTPASARKKAIPWAWSTAPNHYPLVDLTARVRHSAYVLRELPRSRGGLARGAQLRYELRKGGVRTVVWRRAIAQRHGSPRAALVVSGARIFFARHNLTSTGCTLYAFSRPSGRQLWKAHLRGYGPVFHSRWFNRVQLRIIRGNPVVFGHEGPGTSYVEMRNAATGTLISHRKFRSRQPPKPLAERLFNELHRALMRAPHYRRTVTAFVRGHMLKSGPPRATVSRFRRAVAALNGLPLQRGRYHLVVRLVRRPNGTYVIRARRR